MEKEEIIYKKINELKCNPNNPRKNDEAVEAVAKSIEKYGFRNPLIVDENNIVWCGNTRLKASRKLGLEEVPCIVIKDLTEKQMRELALLDNKTNEIAEWDFDLLSKELADLDLGEFDLDWGIVNEEENPYTTKITIPQYEITTECPEIKSLVDESKTNELIEEIKSKNLENDIEDFLIKATQRHLMFDYAKIAEFYAHQNKEIQELMEKSALVIIDYDDAIANGYVKIKNEIDEIREFTDE